LENLVLQALSGLASASSLFLVASGLTVIFGVSRVVNFAHGSLYMLGAYLAWTLVTTLPRGHLGFWGGVLGAALLVALIGLLVEVLLLRRIYRAPELFQLLATFGVVLIVQDLALMTWGPQDLLGPRAPGLRGSVDILGQRFPTYELFLIGVGPLMLGLLWLLFHRTRWGTLVRAATQDREMVGALGVNQRMLFTSVFFLGSLLAGLGGANQRAPTGAVEQQPQQAKHHRADTDQEQLIGWEALAEDVHATAQPRCPRAEQVLCAPGHQCQVLHDQHHAEGRQQLEQLRRPVDTAQQQHLHHQPDERNQ
jgi:branched-subunit amino acid ABC-type transport system permease component